MRKQFVKTIEEVIAIDQNLTLLLGDIGVFGFNNVLNKYSDRAFNIGILEQSTIGVASGLSLSGFNPVVHTIAPFIVERAFEQLKIDFGYQNLKGNFISVGASFDYAALGCTHHCPGDFNILKNIPNFSLICPGTAIEFDILFKQAYNNQTPNYFRLSEECNTTSQNDVSFSKMNLIQSGDGPIIIAVGSMLDKVINASSDLDPTIIYITTIRPFDFDIFKNIDTKGRKIIICEPYYSGAITQEILEIVNMPNCIKHIGIPNRFINNYGTYAENCESLQIDVMGIRNKILSFINI
jgi:transketolase